jgi:hypothetical protein
MGSLYSKFMGEGWAIYVMDPVGRFFVGQHKVGLFHYSSFLGGVDLPQFDGQCGYAAWFAGCLWLSS